MGCLQSKPDSTKNKTTNGHIPNGNGHLPNGNVHKKRPNSAINNKNRTNGHIKNGTVPNGHVKNGTVPNGHVKNGKVPNGHVKNGKVPNGHVKNGKVPNGHVKNGTLPNGHVKNGTKKGPGSAKVAQAPEPVRRHEDAQESELSRTSSFMLRKHIGKEKELMIKVISENVIGINATFDGPFGRRKVIYCDFVASGKPVKFIEDFITQNVLPFYANTHTTTSVSAQQTSTFREEAREMVKFCCNATDEDAVIFTGSGSTAAIHKLISVIELRGEKAKKTAVIIGPTEHHSNILPWRESGAKVIRIKETTHGHLDMEDLKDKLQESTAAGLDVIVSLSAASNVTGIKTDSVSITELVHEHGGLCFWDYACAGPYLEVNMNPTTKGYKDAVFLSVHKFLGGTSTPGVLIAKRALFNNAVPGGVGGGTVAYVFKDTARYLSNIEEREEGGTPAIVESIRAALAFQLKQEVGSGTIERIEDDLCKRAFKVWKKNSNLQILGSHTADRLPIFSLLISHPPSRKFLHHNFVSILLNDLYGIQARGGCACAGPYAIDLLSITEEVQNRILPYLKDEDAEGIYKKPIDSLKPGFARLNFPFFYDKKTVEFIIKAVDRVASDGWKLLPLYTYDPYSASWQHRVQGRPLLVHLTDTTLVGNKLTVTAGTGLHTDGGINLQQVLIDADTIFDQALDMCQGLNLDEERVPVPEADQEMVWFLEPRVALMYLRTPGLKYFTQSGAKLPFAARRNTLVNVRTQFMHSLKRLGYDTDKLQSTQTFYAGGNEEESTVSTCHDDSCQ